MAEMTDADVFGKKELSDSDVFGSNLSKLGTDPYEKYRLGLAHGATPENYSELGIPPVSNPDYDATRFMAEHPIDTIRDVASAPIQLAETGIRKVMDVPDILRNKIKGVQPGDAFYHPTFSERSEEGTQPIIRFPKSSGTGAIAGAENLISDTATGLLGNPEKMVMLGLTPGRAGAALFGVSMAASLPDEVKHAIEVYKDPKSTTAQKVEAAANPVVQSIMAALMLKHAGSSEPVPPLQGPPAIGSMLKTPEGAIPPLRVEESQPLNPQTGSPLSPQELIARQSRVPTPGAPAEPPVKTFDLTDEFNQQEGNQNAIQKQSPSSVLQHPQETVGETGGGRERVESGEQGKEVAGTQETTEPVTRTGDARGADDEEASKVTSADAAKLLNKPLITEKDVDSMSTAELSDENIGHQAGMIAGLDATESDLPRIREKYKQAHTAMQVATQATMDAMKNDDVDAVNNAQAAQTAAYGKNNFYGGMLAAITKDAEGAKGNFKGLQDQLKAAQPSPKEISVGPGAASPRAEFGEPGGNAGREVYGISHEVREARAKAGVVDPVERGEGITTPDSITRGRQLLQSGTDPEKVLQNFETTKRFSSDDIAVVRAHGERLAQDARAAERKFGTESPEYDAAYKKLSDWDRRSKVMQTEWHKQGMAQQGATDIDTGSFTGLKREFENSTGETFTPKQEKTAKDLADKVTKSADATEKAKGELFDQLDKESGDPKAITNAERRALDAANRTVRDAAARLAQAETKERVAKSDAEKKAAQAERAKEQKAVDLSNKKAREAAVRLADAENKQRISDAKKAEDDTQAKAEQKALDAANKTVRDAAARKAKAENDARVAKSKSAKDAAIVAAKREQKAIDAANKVIRDAASKAAAKARNELAMSLPERAWNKAREYIDKGITNFDDIRNNIATDLGLPVDKVTAALGKSKRAKFLTDDLWKKQQEYRRLDEQAKRWLRNQQLPMLQKVAEAIPNLLFGLKVGFHGTVALGTHAPAVAFQPRFWENYAKNFANMYHMVGSPAFYEHQVQDLIRRPNYTVARRSGLVNDPFQFEDYNSPDVQKYFGRFAKMGNRGYSVLKFLRQDMFDQMWDKLPQTQKIPQIAEAIADGINHATGVVKVNAPKGANLALFAPRLELSRAAWLAGDPIRAAKAFSDWKNASEGEKAFAINQVKEKAWVVGTLLSMLAANQGILSAVGSKQKINFTDPNRSDWMKFKAAGMNFSYGNAMLSMARLPFRLEQDVKNERKTNKLIYEDENVAKTLWDYGRSQASPAASTLLTLGLGRDYAGRPLPRAGFGLLPGKTNIPKRLQASGITKPYTWPEFLTESLSAIPFEEAEKEVWKNGLGMTHQQQMNASKALATIAVMSATGGRLSEDYEPKQKP